MRVPFLDNLNRELKPQRRKLRAKILTLRGRREDAVEELARSADGLVSREQLRLLYRTALETAGPGDIAEIGSWKGRSTIALGAALLDRGEQDCRIWAIDHHVGGEELKAKLGPSGSTLDVFRANIERAGVSEFITPLVMNSDEGARELSKRGVTLRMVFIDGGHDEESARNDIVNFLPLMRPGGIVALHDCHPDWEYPGVWRAYQKELQPRVEEIGSATHLLVTRLRE